MLCGSRRHTTLMQRTSLCFAAVKLRFVYFKLAFPQALLRGSVCGFLAALPEALSLTSCFFRPPSFQPSPSKLRGPIFEAARLFCKRAAVASACPNARKIFSPASFFKSAMWLEAGRRDRPPASTLLPAHSRLFPLHQIQACNFPKTAPSYCAEYVRADFPSC